MRALFSTIIIISASVALADTSPQSIIDTCSKATTTDIRIQCLEFAVRNLAAQPDTEGAKTKDVVTQAPLEYKVADAEDLYVSPNKFKGKGVELRGMACFHADKGDYRCIARGGTTLAVFAKDVAPSDARAKLEDDCGQIKKASTGACRRNIRFVASEFDSDTVSGYQKRVVFTPAVIEFVTQSPSSKKR